MHIRNYHVQAHAGSGWKTKFLTTALISFLLLFWIAEVGPAAAQTITSLSTNSLAQAGRLKIIGSGFGTTQGTSLVMIGATVAPVSTWSNTAITAYVSDSAPVGVDQVQVLTTGGGSNKLPLTVTARQAAGRVAWRFQADGFYIQGRPGIAPDGTVYALDVGGHLYALAPNGGVKWIFSTGPVAIQSVDVGPDGTVYFGSAVNTVYALNPDGTLKWKVRDPSGAQVGAGPTVGPDGNIYAVTQDSGLPNGLGEMTLSPAGQVLSSRPGFLTGRGHEFLTREIVFGAVNQFYFVMNNVFDATNGLQFFELGGDFLFARLAGGGDEQPAVDAGGNIYSNIASNQLGVFDANGNLLRSSFFGSLTSPSLVSDGTIYAGESFPTSVLALNPDLSVKWKLPNNIGYFAAGPAVNSSNTMVVVGVNGIGTPSAIQGIDALTGTLSWQLDLPEENGGFVRPMSQPRFAGANRVYVGMDVNDAAPDVYTYLYAINTAPRITLASLTLDPATVKGGAASQGTVTLTRNAPSNGAVVRLGSSNTAVAKVPRTVTVPAGTNSVTFTVRTRPVSANTAITISASFAGVRMDTTLAVTP